MHARLSETIFTVGISVERKLYTLRCMTKDLIQPCSSENETDAYKK